MVKPYNKKSKHKKNKINFKLIYQKHKMSTVTLTIKIVCMVIKIQHKKLDIKTNKHPQSSNQDNNMFLKLQHILSRFHLDFLPPSNPIIRIHSNQLHILLHPIHTHHLYLYQHQHPINSNTHLHCNIHQH